MSDTPNVDEQPQHNLEDVVYDMLRRVLSQLSEDSMWCLPDVRGAPRVDRAKQTVHIDEAAKSITQLFAKQLQEAEIRARLEEVTYWHKRTIREAPHPSQISSTLHEQEARIATLTQDTKGGTDDTTNTPTGAEKE